MSYHAVRIGRMGPPSGECRLNLRRLKRRHPRRPAMSMNKPVIEQFRRAVATSLHEHWVLFLIEGIILVILGLAAIVIPPIATLAIEILFGWLFLISGIVGL